MPDRNQAALDFLLTRRSHPPKTLTLPIPDRAGIEAILTAGTRVPDHGKLEPWRLLVLRRAALDRLAKAAGEHAARVGMDPDLAAKGVNQFANAHLIVAVIFSPKGTEKVPLIEQVHSAGAVCLSLVNAALASGWGAGWLTGWVAHDRGFATPAFGLTGDEEVTGLVHIGTATQVSPERPRPDLSAVVEWVEA